MGDEKAPAQARVDAANSLLDRAYGKPQEAEPDEKFSHDEPDESEEYYTRPCNWAHLFSRLSSLESLKDVPVSRHGADLMAMAMSDSLLAERIMKMVIEIVVFELRNSGRLSYRTSKWQD
jgi:hypothetical protein